MYRVCKRLRTPLYSERHPIGLRSESDWVAFGIRLDGVRCTMMDCYQLRTDVYVINNGLIKL